MSRIMPDRTAPVIVGENGPEVVSMECQSGVPDGGRCEYCGSRVVDSRGNCGACGAPLPSQSVAALNMYETLLHSRIFTANEIRALNGFPPVPVE